MTFDHNYNKTIIIIKMEVENDLLYQKHINLFIKPIYGGRKINKFDC